MNLKREKGVALKAAKSASKILIRYFGNNKGIKEKSNKSLVAKADLEANKAVISLIRKNFPNHSILSEETGIEKNKSDFKWVIDPLDGTHNFIHGIPIFGTSIALEHKNEVMLGVLHFPILKLTAVAEKGKGAFVNGKKIKVSNKKTLDYSFLMLEYSSTERHKTAALIKKLKDNTLDVRNFGSAIYDLLLVASGKSEAYIIFRTNEWDVAAGVLLVEEAGGQVTGLDGKKYSLNDKEFLVSNGKLSNKLLDFLR